MVSSRIGAGAKSWAGRRGVTHTSRAKPETKRGGPVVYLGADPKTHWLASGELKEGLINTGKVFYKRFDPVGSWSPVLPGEL